MPKMPAHILIVDDEPDLELLIKQRFRHQIHDSKYDFDFAGNGIEALKKIENGRSFDIVLTDINMPHMDGLTLIGIIKENFPLLKSVIISAYGDMKNIRTAFNRGAFDFITKPIDFSDLETTINRTLTEALSVREAFDHRNQVINMQKELDVAREIQQSILPSVFPAFPGRKDLDVFAKMTAAKKVGGDLFDFFFVSENLLAFCIGDVSGKGVPAALFMAVTKTLLKSIAFQNSDPAECLKKVNNILFKESVSSVYVTMVYGTLNTKTGELYYSNGGHNPFYILSTDGTLRTIDPNGGIPVSYIENFSYQTSALQLKDRDMIILFTDGVTEAMNNNEEEFSETRLEHTLTECKKSTPQQVIENVFRQVERHTENEEQSDDITMLAVQYIRN
jgi:sigma-B regulation protein RsbU (phosphoserine phosphatase)